MGLDPGLADQPVMDGPAHPDHAAARQGASTCASCGRVQRRDGAHCELCGTPLRRHEPPPALPATPGADASQGSGWSAPPLPSPERSAPIGHGRPSSVLSAPREDPAERARRARSRAIQFLLLGLPLAGLFTVTPIVRFMGWFLSSLFHESGHALAGWFMGHPTIPKISLEGHAMASHGEAMWVVRAAVIAGTVALLRTQLSGARLRAVLTVIGALYAALILTPLGEVLFLTSGHMGELAMAAVCLWRAATEDACHHDAERAAYATLGWYLAIDNVVLSFGLAFSESARATYATSGSFGLTNDYLRLAQEHLGTGVAPVGALTGVMALAVVACAILAGLRAAR